MGTIKFMQNPFLTQDLYPFSLTRDVEDIRVGIFTIKEKWERLLRAKKGFYLIHNTLLPSKKLWAQVNRLKPGEAIGTSPDDWLVYHVRDVDDPFPHPEKLLVPDDAATVNYPWEIFEKNKDCLLFDFEHFIKKQKPAKIDRSNAVENPKNIFIEEGAVVKHCVLNADEGSIYIGKNTLVMEGSCLRGPISIGEKAVVKMGAKIYGATTVGPHCTVGGEIKNSVLFANSNKAHDGYLGDSVIGEWCNIGAGCSNSNLKNTAGNIAVHLQGRKYTVGIKCGMLMGDFSRLAVNTAVNTATVIGVSANVFGQGLTPKHIPSFAWGYDKKVRYKPDKAIEDADRWKRLKGQTLTPAEADRLKNIYKHSK
ncbi:MAG: putative sugar nucleotidyl transferase [Niabella sp.]